MKCLLAATAIVLTLPATFIFPVAAQDPEWIATEVFVAEIEQAFNRCMDTAVNAGAPVTNGLLLNCTPSGNEMADVIAGIQPVTGMVACVDWSLASMAGIVSDEMMGQLNSKTRCETEGIETSSLYEMWEWVRESEIEPYGI